MKTSQNGHNVVNSQPLMTLPDWLFRGIKDYKRFVTAVDEPFSVFFHAPSTFRSYFSSLHQALSLPGTNNHLISCFVCISQDRYYLLRGSKNTQLTSLDEGRNWIQGKIEDPDFS